MTGARVGPLPQCAQVGSRPQLARWAGMQHGPFRTVRCMAVRRTWRDERVNALLAAVDALGLSMSRAAAVELIDERVRLVASQMRVSPSSARIHLTDEAIQGLAQTIAFSVVEETPGAALLSAPRDAVIPVQLVGRVSAGLAEAVRIRLNEREDLEHTREAVAQVARAQGVLGLIVADQVAKDVDDEPCVRAPRALLHRLARYLEAAAALCDEGVLGHGVAADEVDGLPAALRNDADVLRTLASEPSD